jgi:hypothetical protein
LGACPQPRCHHINHQPSKQRILLPIGTNQGCTSPEKVCPICNIVVLKNRNQTPKIWQDYCTFDVRKLNENREHFHLWDIIQRGNRDFQSP